MLRIVSQKNEIPLLPLYLPVQIFQRNKQFLRWLNRLLAVLAILWLIRFWSGIGPGLLIQYLSRPVFLLGLLPIVLLSLMNWGIETMKWKYLISPVIPNIGFRQTLQSVLAGVTLGIISPNRTGEVLGRVFSLPFPKRYPGFVFHACGSFSQFTATLLLGGAFSLGFGSSRFMDFWLHWGFVSVLSGLVFMLLMLFPERILSRVDLIVMRWGIASTEIEALHRPRFLLPPLLFSLLRFLVYSFQLSLLWIIMDDSVSFFTIFTLSAVMFLAVSVIPSMAISEIGIRGAVLVHLAESLNLNSTPAVIAAAVLWLINVAVPALAGIVPLQKIEWFQVKK